MPTICLKEDEIDKNKIKIYAVSVGFYGQRDLDLLNIIDIEDVEFLSGSNFEKEINENGQIDIEIMSKTKED